MSLPHTSERGDNIAFIAEAPAMTSLSRSDARLLFAARVRTHSLEQGRLVQLSHSHKCLKLGHKGACSMHLAALADFLPEFKVSVMRMGRKCDLSDHVTAVVVGYWYQCGCSECFQTQRMHWNVHKQASQVFMNVAKKRK